jgi:hypothetical protein
MSSFFSKLEGRGSTGQTSNFGQALTNPLAFAEKVYGHAREEVIGMLQFMHLIVQEHTHVYTGIINPNRMTTRLLNL